jgi:hypothetical protein
MSRSNRPGSPSQSPGPVAAAVVEGEAKAKMSWNNPLHIRQQLPSELGQWRESFFAFRTSLAVRFTLTTA